jgi:hypothetical protein
VNAPSTADAIAASGILLVLLAIALIGLIGGRS